MTLPKPFQWMWYSGLNLELLGNFVINNGSSIVYKEYVNKLKELNTEIKFYILCYLYVSNKDRNNKYLVESVDGVSKIKRGSGSVGITKAQMVEAFIYKLDNGIVELAEKEIRLVDLQKAVMEQLKITESEIPISRIKDFILNEWNSASHQGFYLKLAPTKKPLNLKSNKRRPRGVKPDFMVKPNTLFVSKREPDLIARPTNEFNAYLPFNTYFRAVFKRSLKCMGKTKDSVNDTLKGGKQKEENKVSETLSGNQTESLFSKKVKEIGGLSFRFGNSIMGQPVDFSVLMFREGYASPVWYVDVKHCANSRFSINRAEENQLLTMQRIYESQFKDMVNYGFMIYYEITDSWYFLSYAEILNNPDKKSWQSLEYLSKIF
jgi:hypothetical protein